ncbi:hypothetical protein NOSIN_07280 [Nocardiopsis sinuspersici]|uniref:Uncharacterized protein n=1 Tax=Nocardiopsis sinuspersici TaxID=501010 RepID=A0A1V3BYT9_9ACTN|nr:hypothetical protein NOSIN_07280 [Nocardiopsis sinuspersici]
MDVEPAYVPGLDDGAPHVTVSLVSPGPRFRSRLPGSCRAAGRLSRVRPRPPSRDLVGRDPHEEVGGSHGDFAGEQARGEGQEELEERYGAEPGDEFAGRLRQV